jgi:hypothetical protein
MATETVKALSAEEITDLCLRHTLYDWSAQSGLKAMAVESAKRVYFQTIELMAPVPRRAARAAASP